MLNAAGILFKTQDNEDFWSYHIEVPETENLRRFRWNLSASEVENENCTHCGFKMYDHIIQDEHLGKIVSFRCMIKNGIPYMNQKFTVHYIFNKYELETLYQFYKKEPKISSRSNAPWNF